LSQVKDYFKETSHKQSRNALSQHRILAAVSSFLCHHSHMALWSIYPDQQLNGEVTLLWTDRRSVDLETKIFTSASGKNP